MATGTASVEVEVFGVRLTCACGVVQYYSGVDDGIYLCTGCGRQYKLTRTPAGLVLQVVR